MNLFAALSVADSTDRSDRALCVGSVLISTTDDSRDSRSGCDAVWLSIDSADKVDFF